MSSFQLLIKFPEKALQTIWIGIVQYRIYSMYQQSRKTVVFMLVFYLLEMAAMAVILTLASAQVTGMQI